MCEHLWTGHTLVVTAEVVKGIVRLGYASVCKSASFYLQPCLLVKQPTVLPISLYILRYRAQLTHLIHKQAWPPLPNQNLHQYQGGVLHKHLYVFQGVCQCRFVRREHPLAVQAQPGRTPRGIPQGKPKAPAYQPMDKAQAHPCRDKTDGYPHMLDTSNDEDLLYQTAALHFVATSAL